MVSLFLCCLLGGLRGLAQSGAPGLCGRVDHCYQFAGGNPHLPAAGCAAVEGKAGDHRGLWISHPGHQVSHSTGATEVSRPFEEKMESCLLLDHFKERKGTSITPSYVSSES